MMLSADSTQLCVMGGYGNFLQSIFIPEILSLTALRSAHLCVVLCYIAQLNAFREDKSRFLLSKRQLDFGGLSHVL